jgi:hypothetical protein
MEVKLHVIELYGPRRWGVVIFTLWSLITGEIAPSKYEARVSLVVGAPSEK